MKFFTFFLILIINSNLFAQVENAVFAVVKLSYNIPGETPVTGGICGSAFLINDSTALTAHHVLNNSIAPNPGFKFCQFWLIKRNTKLIIPISNENFICLPDIETTIIKLENSIRLANFIRIEKESTKINSPVFNIGHIGGSMPIKNANWQNNILNIINYSLLNLKSDSIGVIKSIKKCTINTNDVNLNNITVVQPSFKAIEGMSGGPLLNKSTNKLIGLMSFGLPADSTTKNIVFAISVNEIIRRFNSIDMKF